ncbi:unnamed protein product [Effrenium voratum]|nr:unnamed protein product [Effrenium voratum]
MGIHDIPEQVQLRLVLQEPVAKVLLPQHCWLSEPSLPISTGFHTPAAVTPKLVWRGELFIHVDSSGLPSLATQCQIKFREVQNSEPSFTAEPQQLGTGTTGMLLPLLSLALKTNFRYSAALRVGDGVMWSQWGDFGESVSISLPEVWSVDRELVASEPVNRRVKLDWAQLHCALGPVPLECVVCLATEAPEASEKLVGMCSCQAAGLGCTFRDRLEVAINGFEPGTRYQFVLHARAQLPLKIESAESLLQLGFKEVARSPRFQWPTRLSEEWSLMVDWSLPIPRQVLIPDDGELEESSQRWLGRAVLLAWPREEAKLLLEMREDSQRTHQVFGWKEWPWVRIRLQGVDYVAACDLPCDVVRFRWRGNGTPNGTPGPCSDGCTAHLAAPAVSAELSLREKLSVELRAEARGERGDVGVRARYRLVPGHGSGWRVLLPQASRTYVLGQEDGLQPGRTYVFAMQLLARGRRSQWSETAPLALQLPLGLELDAKLTVVARRTTSVTVSWPELSSLPDQSQVEFRLDIHRVMDATSEHQTSVLLEGADGKPPPCEATVFNLCPAAEYSAELFLRCVRLGSRRWLTTGLCSHFITPEER